MPLPAARLPMPEKKTVEAYAAALPPAQKAIVARLRAIVKSAAPDATESIKWAQPVYETSGPFAHIKAAKSHVTFGFWRGAELDAGLGVLEGSGAKMAHIKLTSVSDIDERQLAALVKKAVKLNQSLGDPTKGR